MRALQFCKIFVLILSLAAGLLAQTYQGTISGTVRDQSGAVVPGASVEITDIAKGTNRHLQSNSVGDYAAPDLEPGLYRITAESAGFRKIMKDNVRLEVARSIRIDFVLSPGSEQQTVAVTEEAPVVDVTTATLEGTFTNNAIVSLPLQGRDWQNLVTLRPGIQRSPGGGFLSITSNGNRYEDNNYIVDGIDDNDAYYGESVINSEGVQGTPATHLPIDAIQEFNVQESPEADYGWKPGAIVQLGIKSGSNALHGTAYYFGRNSALDARNYFNPKPDPTSALRLHQYGASVGGPIVKDKLFFFANYEGVRDIVGNPLILNTPVTAAGFGDGISIPDTIAACQPTCNQLSLQVAKLYPTNLGTYSASDPTLKPFDFNNNNREDNGIVKIDYHLNDRNTFSGRYFIGDSLQVEEDSNVLLPIFLSNANTRAQVAGLSWAWTPTNTLVNQLRFGYNSFRQQIFSGDHGEPATTFGINTGVTDPLNFGMPQIRVSGFNNLGGNSSWPLLTVPNRTWQITDSVVQTKGKHNLKYGGEFRTGSTDNTRNTYGKGRIDFRGLDQFMTGDVRSARIFVGDSRREVSQKSFGFFAQDDWRVTQRFTLTMGLRYDASLPITEAHDQLANFDPAVGLVQVGKQLSQPYNNDWNNVAPRLGFAWDIFGDGKTVLRAGAGIIYEIPHISLYIGQNSADALGLGTIPTGALNVSPGGGTMVAGVAFPNYDWTDSNTPVFGNVPNQTLNCDPSADGPCAILGVDRNIKTPYVANWNLNIQHAFTPTSVLQIAYVGNRGIKLYSVRDINQDSWLLDWQANGSDPDHSVWDGQSGRPFTNPAICGTHCYPSLSYVDMLENKDSSIYHGLQVTFTQKPMHGLDFVAGYTWAKALDDYSGNRSFAWENAYDPLLEWGPANSDIRHRLTLAMTYSVPHAQRWDALLGGWQFSNIVNLETGEPQDYYDGSDYFSATESGNDRWNLYGDPGTFKWGFSGLPFYPASVDSGGNQTGDPRCLSIAAAQGSLDTLNYAGGCFISKQGAILIPPAWGQFGTLHRNSLRGPGYANWDVSLGKKFKMSERVDLQLRLEFFNILNHPNFAGVDHDLSDGFLGTVGIPIYTPDVAASNPVVGSGGSRHIQYGAKIIF